MQKQVRTTNAVIFVTVLWMLPSFLDWDSHFYLSSPVFGPGLVRGAKCSRVWGRALTVIKAVCMHALLSPIRPYSANVCWLSSGRLEKDSYPYVWEPRSLRDLSPDEALCLPARSPWSHIAGGSEDQWAPPLPPLHFTSPASSPGGARGACSASRCSTPGEIGTFSISLIARL